MQDVSGMFHKREIGVRNDTYTRAEIDAKDGAIQAAADKAQQTADSATEKNRTQDTQIAALQKTSHTHSNKDVLDKAEQPYTTAERDKLAGLENYTHPTHTAYSRGLYNITVDSEGHIISATAITKGDITSLGIPGANTTYTFHRDESLNWAESQCNKLQITKHESGVDTQLESIKLIPTVRVSDGFETSGIVYFLTVDSKYCKKDNRNETMWNGDTYDAKTWIRLNTKYSGPVGYKSSAALESEVAIVAPEFIGANATNQKQGLMSPEDKKKLDEMDLSKYLPLSGGVMTGDIDMQTNKKDILIGTQKANTSYGTAVAGGCIDKAAQMISTVREMRSFIGSFHNTNNGKYYNLISVRHRNGCEDGSIFGMYIFSELTTGSADLKWAKQTKTGGWTDDFTLLDSRNFTSYALAKDGTAKKAELLSSGQMRSAYGHNDDASFSNGYAWFKIGTAFGSGGYATITTTFLGVCGYGKHALYTCRMRLTSAGNAVESITFLESGRTGGMPTGLFRVVAINGEKGVTFELWAKGADRWEGTRIVILNEQNLAGGGQSNFWTLTSRGNADAKTTPTTGNMHIDSSDSSVCATAAKSTAATTLTDSGWVAVSNFSVNTSSFSQITTSFRKYGDIIFIRGRVQPKSNMTSISLCSTASTSLTGITPSHSVRGVGISSDGLAPFSVNVTTSPANSVILKGNFLADKIYDFEFSYMK